MTETDESNRRKRLEAATAPAARSFHLARGIIVCAATGVAGSISRRAGEYLANHGDINQR